MSTTSCASTALITGGLSGISRAPAKKLPQLAILVLVVSAGLIAGRADGKADFIAADLRDAARAREGAKKTIDREIITPARHRSSDDSPV